MMWFPTRIHSHYSLLQSTLKPKNIVRICKELGYSAAAMTDFASISGAVKFMQECKENDIKPILGCEIPISTSRNSTVTLICKNIEAWKKLLHIVSACNDVENFKKHPTIGVDDLFDMVDDNFICIDGYVGSALFDEMIEDHHCIYTASEYDDAGSCLKRQYEKDCVVHISKFREKFGEDYFLEVNNLDSELFSATKLVSNCVISVADSLGFDNIIAGANIYYGEAKDARDHRVILCSKMKTTLSKIDVALEKEDNFKYSRFFRSSKYYIPSKKELKVYDKRHVLNVGKINNRCDDYTILSAPNLPQVETVNNVSQIEQLKQLCRDGWSDVLKPTGVVDKKEDLERYRDRVLQELEVIEDGDLAGYFLIVADYVREFRSRGVLVGPGRGSAAGCLVSYLVGITLIDPVKYGLIFSRFFNSARKGSLPDIDIDFPPEERENVITYLKEKYGDDKVCQMLTFGRLQGRSALKEVLRVNDSCGFDQMNEITNKIPQEAAISDKLEEMDEPSVIRWALENDPDTLKEYCWEEDGELKGDFARDFAQALRIEGTFKSQGKHAAGVVVASMKLDGLCPMVRTKGGGKIAGLELGCLENIGAVKFDILGVGALSKCYKTAKA